MCLAVPAKLLEIKDNIGIAEFGGVRREVSVMFVPEAKIGDYILIHAGSAIEIIDEKEAEETIKLFEEIIAIESDLKAWTETAPPEPLIEVGVEAGKSKGN